MAALASVLVGIAIVQCAAQLAAQVGVSGGIYLPPQPDPSAAAAETARVAIRGMVRNAATGDPLARALVQIEGDADTGTLTDGEGRFEIPGVPAGPQTIRVAKPGFRDRPYATEETGLQAEGPAHSVLVAAQMPDLTFALSPDGAIRGHIELSTGDPADGINLTLLKQVVRFGRTVWAQIANTRSNGDGVYRFGGLPDGVYVVYTQPALESEPAVSVVAPGSAARVARSGYPSVYYPDARDPAGAARIRISGGSTAEANFSLTLGPFYLVTAADALQNGANGTEKTGLQSGYTASVMDASGHLLSYAAQYDEATHSLQANLPDGTYVLVVRGFLQPQNLGEGLTSPNRHLRSMGALAGAVEFAVAGHPVTGLRFSLGPPPSATVHLRFLHNTINPAIGNAADPVNFNIDPAGGIAMNSGEGVWSMDIEPDSIAFTAQPGAYWLSGYLPRKGVCAGSLTAGSFNLAREPLVLSVANPAPPMELELRDDCGTLALSLPGIQTAFLPGEEPFYTVYVVPDFDTVADIPPMTMHPSSGPTLTVDGLTPGSYRVYTFNSPVHLEYRNPAALPYSGQQVTVSSGTTTSLTLEVPEN
ncbi:MAG: carboxypeptidase regulatory-like domain-containing protein [Terracidiphilus sp.]